MNIEIHSPLYGSCSCSCNSSVIQHGQHGLYQQPYLHQVIRSSEEEPANDALHYSILSVGVFTLALLLLVDWLRHFLDKQTKGRPFVKAVMERVNHELATLGIVEFFIFVLHKFYEDLDAAKEKSFSNVHFTLFLIAIFNAIQSVSIALRASRRSSSIWVRTEQVDVNHYIEIREEFDRIDQQLLVRKNKWKKGGARAQQNNEEHLEYAFDWTWRAVRSLLDGLADTFRYPMLVYRRRNLLVQIRFHELRVQLIQAQKLPVQIKVSDYLKRSEQAVFIKLVRISTVAWVMLTGALAVAYFLMGMVGYVTGSTKSIGKALYCIYIVTVVLFVFTSLVVNNKMKRIFNVIVHKGRRQGTSRPADDSASDLTPESQLKLFWGAEPRYVITMLRFMEVGYSAHLAILFVFWEGLTELRWNLLISLLVCYGAFLRVVGRTLPRYTLCTSLGQLVDEDRLHETLARFRLGEERREKSQKYDQYESEKLLLSKIDATRPDRNKGNGHIPFTIVETTTGFLVKTAHKGAAMIVHELENALNLSGESVELAVDEGHQGTAGMEERKLLSELVHKNTSSLRRLVSNTGANRGPYNLQQMPAATERDRANSKLEALPELGILAESSLHFLELPPPSATFASEVGTTQENPQKMDREELLSTLVNMDTSTLRSVVPRESPDVTGLAARERALRERRRKGRRKALSDGVASMRQLAGMSPSSQFELSAEGNLTASETTEETPVVPSRARSEVGTPLPSRIPSRRGRYRRKALSESAAMQSQFFSLNETGSSEPPTKLHTSGEGPVPELQDVDFAIPEVLSDQSSNTDLKLPYSLTNIPDGPKHDDDGETETAINSDQSVGGESDTDDIPAVSPSKRAKGTQPKKRKLEEIMRLFYVSKRFKLMSAILGTLPTLFLIGMRVEVLLISSHVIPKAENTFRFASPASFWMETALLIILIITSLFITFLFRPRTCETEKERTAFAAAVLDFFISAVCLILLFVAEYNRCCGDHGVHEGDMIDTEHEITTNCCPRFGRRTFGGLGNIEPFTSLITLRLLRFMVASTCVQRFERQRSWSASVAQENDEENVSEGLEGSHSTQMVPAHAKTKRHSNEEENDRVVELWERALRHFPTIVATYGEFSGELLQVMLGIDVVETKGIHVNPTASREEVFMSPEMEGISEPIKNLLLSEKRYASLSAAARSVIIAGMLGKSVKSTRNTTVNTSFTGSDSSANEAGDENMGTALSHASPSSRSSKKARLPSRDEPPLSNEEGQRLEFEVETSQGDVEMERIAAWFDHPDSTIVRSMRRCDRKFLPYLGNWAVVDVVLTKYELVYFDATEADNIPYLDEAYSVSQRIDEADVGITERMDAIRQAVVATNGGKGLRLCDVAYGRKFAGRIRLADCVSAHVDRYLPSASGGEDQVGDAEANALTESLKPKFWKHRSRTALDTPNSENRWDKINEDHLVIATDAGTLQLRFYGDLEYSELHAESANENDPDGALHKNNALQWCQTIVRFCGTEQLKQNLPHFGDCSVEELRDYLHLVDRPEPLQLRMLLRRHRRIFNRRSSTLGEVEPADELQDLPAIPPPPRLTRRASSQGDVEPNVSNNDNNNNRLFTSARSLKFHRRRFQSAGGAVDLSTVVEHQASVDSAPSHSTSSLV